MDIAKDILEDDWKELDVSKKDITILLKKMKDVMIKKPYFDIKGKDRKITFIGDLHGCIDSLILSMKFLGKSNLYVITGDLIDRGEFSVEIFLVVISMYIVRRNIIYIKGNHEMPSFQMDDNEYKTLRSDLMKMYKIGKDDDLLYLVYDILRNLPFAVSFKDLGIFALHGGPSMDEDLYDLDQFSSLKQKNHYSHGSSGHMILWNDPYEGKCPLDDEYTFHKLRGAGYLYTKKVTDMIFKKNKWLKLIIRGHSHPKEGYSLLHGGKILTLLSNCKNKASVTMYNKGVLLLKVYDKSSKIHAVDIIDLK